MRHVLPLVALLTLASILPGPSAWAEPSEGAPEGAAGPPAMPPVSVEVAEVVLRSVARGRTFVGSVEPSRHATVGSEFGGLVSEFLVEEGDPVEAGQPVARLRTTLLEIQIEAARALLTDREQSLAELENGSRPEEIAQARASVAQLESAVALRRWKYEAAQKLSAQNTISEDELRDARLALRAAELLEEAGRAALALVEAGPRDEQIAQARAAVAMQDAEVRALEEQKDRYELCAPFDGFVVAERTQVGQWVSAGSPIVDIAALDEVDVVVDVVEDFVGGLREGLPVRVEFDAIPERVFTGSIHRIVPSADRRSRTFPVKVRLANERDGRFLLLKAGMFASATLAVGTEKPTLLVPKDAIMLGGFVPVMVWVVGDGDTAQPVPVRLGIAVDDLVEVIGPVQAGMRVVVKGNERIYVPGRKLLVPGAKD